MTSETLYEQATQITPGGVHSPVRAFRAVDRAPVYFEKGSGPYLYDVEGKEYIDFCASFGPHLLGHGPQCVVDAVQAQLQKATSFGACHPGELDLCRAILRGYPFLDQVRLVNSGTEAVMTAIRIARGATGRNKILKFEGGYHGHSDPLLVKSGSGVAELSEAASKGVPASAVSDTLVARLDDIEAAVQTIQSHSKELALIVVEPIPANHGLYLPKREHLQQLCQMAKEVGALIHFDEVISGFRLGLSGACGLYDLQPDLVTLGKVIGGGLPLAAIAGRKAIMEVLAPVGEVYQAGTLSSNPLATAAGLAVLNELEQNPPYVELEKRTKEFAQALQTLLENKHSAKVHHKGSIFWIQLGSDTRFPPEIPDTAKQIYRDLYHRALEQGLYLAPSPYEVGFVSTAHTQAVLEEALQKFAACLS